VFQASLCMSHVSLYMSHVSVFCNTPLSPKEEEEEEEEEELFKTSKLKLPTKESPDWSYPIRYSVALGNRNHGFDPASEFLSKIGLFCRSLIPFHGKRDLFPT
jgi:hypothetical protein